MTRKQHQRVRCIFTVLSVAALGLTGCNSQPTGTAHAKSASDSAQASSTGASALRMQPASLKQAPAYAIYVKNGYLVFPSKANFTATASMLSRKPKDEVIAWTKQYAGFDSMFEKFENFVSQENALSDSLEASIENGRRTDNDSGKYFDAFHDNLIADNSRTIHAERLPDGGKFISANVPSYDLAPLVNGDGLVQIGDQLVRFTSSYVYTVPAATPASELLAMDATQAYSQGRLQQYRPSDAPSVSASTARTSDGGPGQYSPYGTITVTNMITGHQAEEGESFRFKVEVPASSQPKQYTIQLLDLVSGPNAASFSDIDAPTVDSANGDVTLTNGNVVLVPKNTTEFFIDLGTRSDYLSEPTENMSIRVVSGIMSGEAFGTILDVAPDWQLQNLNNGQGCMRDVNVKKPWRRTIFYENFNQSMDLSNSFEPKTHTTYRVTVRRLKSNNFGAYWINDDQRGVEFSASVNDNYSNPSHYENSAPTHTFEYSFYTDLETDYLFRPILNWRNFYINSHNNIDFSIQANGAQCY